MARMSKKNSSKKKPFGGKQAAPFGSKEKQQSKGKSRGKKK